MRPICFFPFLLLAGLLAFSVFLSPAPANYEPAWADPFVLGTPPVRWKEVGTITAAQAYPAVAARDYTTVAALADTKTFVWDLPNQATGFMLSFQTTADADSTTIALMGFMAADGKSRDTSDLLIDDDAIYLGQLVLTGGTQVGKHTNVYVDTVIATDGCWDFEVRDSGNDRRTIVIGDTIGVKKVVGVATTLQASSTLYVEGKTW